MHYLVIGPDDPELDPFSDEATIEFIREVRQHPQLWDSRCRQFRDKKLKRQTWTVVARKFNMNSEGAFKKLNGLRDCFVRELRRLRDRAENNPGPSDKPPTVYKFFEELKFLAPTVRHRRPRAHGDPLDITSIPLSAPDVSLASSDRSSPDLAFVTPHLSSPSAVPVASSVVFLDSSSTCSQDNEDNVRPESASELNPSAANTHLVKEPGAIIEPSTSIAEDSCPRAKRRKKQELATDDARNKTRCSTPGQVEEQPKMEMVAQAEDQTAEDAIDMYCKSFALRLKKLPEQKRDLLIINVEKLLYETKYNT